MKLRLNLKIIFVIVFVVLLGIYIFYKNINNTLVAPKVARGFINLEDWDLKKNLVIPLDGEWEFYLGELLTPSDFEASSASKILKPTGYIKVPSQWKNPLGDNQLPFFGAVTYHVKVKVKDNNLSYGLKALNVRMNSKIYINGLLVGASGTPAKSIDEGYVCRNVPVVAFSRADNNVIDIIIQASNFDYITNGIVQKVFLGTQESIISSNLRQITSDIAAISCLLLVGIYYISTFIIGKKDLSFLYFGLYTMLSAYSVGTNDEKVLMLLFNNLPYLPALKIKDIFINLIAFFICMFAREKGKNFSRPWFVKAIILIVGLNILLVVVLPIKIYSSIEYIFLTVGVLQHIIVEGFILTSILKKDYGTLDCTGACLLLTGFILATTYFISVVLYNNSIIHNSIVGNISQIFLILVLSVMISQQYTMAYNTIESMSRKLLELDRLKDEFLANTSHELRTPLNGIVNIIQSLLKGVAGKLNSSQEQNLQVVVNSSKRLYNLINDILDISSLKNNEVKLHLKPIDVRMVAETVIFVMEHLKGERNIIFKNHISKDIPSVFCDEERLGQIFYNLLENALKFTEKGTITVDAKVSYDKVIIFVRDTGIGIPQDKQNTIFNSFEQLDASISRKNYGIGLGLSITKRLIELQGGEIGVESKHGAGSTFFFTLMISKEKPQNSIKRIEEHFETQSIKAEDFNDKNMLDNYNVMAVEDDVANLKALVNNLRLYNYTVMSAKNGYEALELLADGVKFDIIILDIMMPGISGYDVLKEIRKKYLPIQLPVLLLTASSRTEDISTGFKLGGNDYLIKPFEPEELNVRVQNLIQIKKAVNNMVASELSFLQAQIKPHFIYNALSVISSLSIKEPEKAKELILDLSDYLRGSFDFESREGLTVIHKELELVKSYLSIEQARFKERLSVEFVIDNIECTLPMMCIQPLVENAVRHGVMPMLSGGKICVSVLDEGDCARISVSDNGLGINEKNMESLLSGEVKKGSVGLKNIHRRLMVLYGKGLTITRGEEKGTKVEFIIPYKENGRKKI